MMMIGVYTVGRSGCCVWAHSSKATYNVGSWQRESEEMKKSYLVYLWNVPWLDLVAESGCPSILFFWVARMPALPPLWRLARTKDNLKYYWYVRRSF